MFDGGQGARSAKSGADGDLQRHLLVGGPLGVAAKPGKIFQNFGGGRAGIAGAEGHARVPGRKRNGFVAAQQQPVSVVHSMP